MKTNQKSTLLKSAHTSHVVAFAALAKVHEYFLVAEANCYVLDAGDVEKCRLVLGDVLASRRMGEASEEDEAKARTDLNKSENAFSAAKVQAEAAASERAGLDRRLAAAQMAESSARKALSAAEKEWLLEELMLADQGYTDHASKLAAHYSRVKACAAALSKRGFKDFGPFALSGDVDIPTIGPVSCAAALERLGPRVASSAGKSLYSASRTDMYKLIKNNEIEDDLLALTSASSGSALARFTKAVVDLAGSKDS